MAFPSLPAADQTSPLLIPHIITPHGLAQLILPLCFRSPNPPVMCRGGPAKIPATSLASIAATYPCRLTTGSLGSHSWDAWASLATAARH